MIDALVLSNRESYEKFTIFALCTNVKLYIDQISAILHQLRSSRRAAFVFAGSSNGRTSPSGGEYLGSSPSPAAA